MSEHAPWVEASALGAMPVSHFDFRVLEKYTPEEWQSMMRKTYLNNCMQGMEKDPLPEASYDDFFTLEEKLFLIRSHFWTVGHLIHRL